MNDGIHIIDFDAIANLGESSDIVGTPRDLIRDAHDNPATWLHNAHAQPDDDRLAFLVGRGWSATPERRKLLFQSRIPVMAINDYPADPYCKPRYWVAGDPAGYYGERIWSDIEVMKFSPIASVDSVRPRLDAYAPKLTPRDAPNGHFYHQVCNDVDVEGWLHKPWINWGQTIYGENVPKTYFTSGAARSSMLCGIRLLWHLGYRQIALLGCDCTPGHHPSSMYWQSILDYVGKLAPTFQRWGLRIVQTNPDAHLRCFEIKAFEEVMR